MVVTCFGVERVTRVKRGGIKRINIIRVKRRHCTYKKGAARHVKSLINNKRWKTTY